VVRPAAFKDIGISMKIGYCTKSVSREAGGLFFSVRSLALHLNAILPDQVAVYSLKDASSDQDRLQWMPLKPQLHPICGPQAIGYSKSLCTALQLSRCDLLHTQGIWHGSSLAVHLWHSKTKKPYFVSPRGMLDQWAVHRSRLKKRLASFLYEGRHLRDSRCIHALCKSEAVSIRDYGLKNPICVIPNGVDLPEDFNNSRSDRSSRPKQLLFLGRLHPKKGLVSAIKAWARLTRIHSPSKRNANWQLLIAGWDQGGHQAELKTLCNELGLKFSDIPAAEFVQHQSLPCIDKKINSHMAAGAVMTDQPLALSEHDGLFRSVVFLGPAFGAVKDELLRQANAFILPSYSEGLPMAVLEAWAYTLPVLMTDQCNLPEGFSSESAIRICLDRSCNSTSRMQDDLGRDMTIPIEQSLNILMEMNDEDLMAMGDRGRALVKRDFSWPKIALEMKGVYEWCAGGGSRPGCMVC
jgi:glycosyltransferase involved in cell wall biosynthesis